MAETHVILTPDQRVRVLISSALEELAADLSSAAPITRLAPFPVTCHCAAGPVPLLEHRRAGRTVQDVDLVGSPYMPHHPAEQGTELLGVEGHAPGSITAAHAGLDDALVVAETPHRAPPFPLPIRRSPKARSDTHRNRLMRACRPAADGSTPPCPVATAAASTPAQIPGPSPIIRPAGPVTSGNANGRIRRSDTGSNFTPDATCSIPGARSRLEMTGRPNLHTN